MSQRQAPYRTVHWIEEDTIRGVKIVWQNCIECGDKVFTGMPKEEALCGGKKCVRDRCKLCGYEGEALDDHHIHGRKNSDETVRVCANCHREIHAGVRKI